MPGVIMGSSLCILPILQKMDPQLYKLLEVSWETWTDSGIDVRFLRDSSRVGVYTGICGSEVPTSLSSLK